MTTNRPHYFRACLITAIVTCIVTLLCVHHSSMALTAEGSYTGPTVSYSVRTPIAQTYRINLPAKDTVELPNSMIDFPHQTVICQGADVCMSTSDGGNTTTFDLPMSASGRKRGSGSGHLQATRSYLPAFPTETESR